MPYSDSNSRSPSPNPVPAPPPNSPRDVGTKVITAVHGVGGSVKDACMAGPSDLDCIGEIVNAVVFRQQHGYQARGNGVDQITASTQ